MVSPSMQHPRSSTPINQPPAAQRPPSRQDQQRSPAPTTGQGAPSPTPRDAGVLGGYGRGRGISQRLDEISVSARSAGVSVSKKNIYIILYIT